MFFGWQHCIPHFLIVHLKNLYFNWCLQLMHPGLSMHRTSSVQNAVWYLTSKAQIPYEWLLFWLHFFFEKKLGEFLEFPQISMDIGFKKGKAKRGEWSWWNPQFSSTLHAEQQKSFIHWYFGLGYSLIFRTIKFRTPRVFFMQMFPE